MTPLPPPRLPNGPLRSSPEPESTSRLRLGAIALVASTLAVGGIAIGSQFVSASSPSADESVAQPIDDGPADDEGTGDEIDDLFTEVEHCFFGSGVIDLDDADLGSIEEFLDEELLSEMFEGADGDCTSIIPEGLQDNLAEWEEFDNCLNNQLGFEDGLGLPGVGSVTIDIPSEDGFDFSIYDFGDGDGSITIAKTGDDISVSADGDVSEVEDFSFGQMDDEFAAAHEACASLLPEGVDIQELAPVSGSFEIFGSNND